MQLKNSVYRTTDEIKARIKELDVRLLLIGPGLGGEAREEEAQIEALAKAKRTSSLLN